MCNIADKKCLEAYLPKGQLIVESVTSGTNAIYGPGVWRERIMLLKRNFIASLFCVAVVIYFVGVADAQVNNSVAVRGVGSSTASRGSSTLSGFRSYSTSAASLQSRNARPNSYAIKPVGGISSRPRRTTGYGQIRSTGMPTGFGQLLASRQTTMGSFRGAAVGQTLALDKISSQIPLPSPNRNPLDTSLDDLLKPTSLLQQNPLSNVLGQTTIKPQANPFRSSAFGSKNSVLSSLIQSKGRTSTTGTGATSLRSSFLNSSSTTNRSSNRLSLITR